MPISGARTKYYLLSVLGALGAFVVLALLPTPAQAQEAPSIDKECTPNPVQIRQQIICQIDVVAAPETLAGVRVTDALPTGLTLTGANSQLIVNGFPQDILGCTMTGNSATCPPEPFLAAVANATIAPGIVDTLSFRVTLEATAAQCGSFQNTATAEGEVANVVGGRVVLPFVPFPPAQDSEDITVEGCEEASGGPSGGPAPITQEGEQESESGEIDQTFDVS